MKIYKKGNYILFDDGVILNMEHANQTMLNKDSINGSSYTFYSDNLGNIKVDFTDIQDEFGNDYASISAFDEIIFDATGFNTAGGGSSAVNPKLLALTELSATALVTHTVTTSSTATAINLNSDATNRFAKVVFIAPPSGQVSVNINFDAVLTNSATNLRIGLHNSSTATTTPTNGWFRVNGDDDGASNGYSAEFILTGLTAGTSYTRYFVATCNYGSTLIRASSSQTGVFAITDLPQPLRIKVEDLGTITILSNPNS